MTNDMAVVLLTTQPAQKNKVKIKIKSLKIRKEISGKIKSE